MISEERNSFISKEALTFPVGILISSPKRRLAKLGRKPSNSSSTSGTTTRSAESASVRQPAKSKIRRHNNRLSTVFTRSTSMWESTQGYSGVEGTMLVTDDPSELSNQISTPGILKVFGNDICKGAHYKSVLATTRSSAKELVKEAVERYCLDKAAAGDYVLCDVIGHVGTDRQWKTECSRVVGDNEKPLMLQSLWKPKEGYSRRFEIQRRAAVEERDAKEVDTVTAGINAQARKLQKIRSRVASAFGSRGRGSGGGDGDGGPGLWRSLSEMNLPAEGEEAVWECGTLARGHVQSEADKETCCLGAEKEDTESSDDNGTQYSIHPPFDFPYFLLLEGYSYSQDFLIYLMTGSGTIFGRCSDYSTGEEVERANVDVHLAGPDILPQHCCVRRVEVSSLEDRRKAITVLRPLHGALIKRNGILLKDEVELQSGDLIQLGSHYTFMFKDPTASPECQTRLWLSKPRCAQTGSVLCHTCGSSLAETQKRQPGSENTPPSLKDTDGRDLVLLYPLELEDRILQEIIAMVDPQSAEPKLTPAFLLCLCIQHSATRCQTADLRRLLLRIASQVQIAMWEKTKELAAVQPEMGANGGQAESGEVRLPTMDELIPGLQPLVLWMANAIELLHFIQQEVPNLLPWNPEGLVDLDLSRSAMEESVTVLEEVIMFTFQQSVYYLTKTLYADLPALLDSNPFSESGQLADPEGVSSVLAILKQTLQLLNSFQVHSEITSQLFAYLFFFINASLFNALMERGSGGGFYKWSKGVQIQANLDLLMDWVQGIGLSDLALDFFQKLSSAVNLLATPKEHLLQASWSTLRREFLHLNPAQLHHILMEYDPGRVCPAGWNPTPDEADTAQSTADILESFDNHPPLILPSASFHLELGKSIKHSSLCMQLGKLQGIIQSLHTAVSSVNPKTPLQPVERSQAVTPESSVEADVSETGAAPRKEEPPVQMSKAPSTGPGDLTSCEAVLTYKLKNLELQNTLGTDGDPSCSKRLALDPSCLLTPPNTPQGPELAEAEAVLHTLGISQELINHKAEEDSQTSRCVERSEGEEDEEEEVFTVELQRGPQGLGLALVDGMKTSLKVSGIYIKSVVQESPAALCQKLSQGDRILAVNGLSLVGMDYTSGRDLIRTAGDRLRLLVAKSELCSRSSPAKC
ncbi:ras-associating and dilute domain-containing protein isoform X2 [Brienomyrus brachyistius]|uniref:ras-associating and dilute domain-containing protein isoform X1 n=2 Tax=Brienomyrus brachyistius TaxID=42636 RepID=UPI0020B39C50|nr:ras-associating and dilute domain-containing protein isoform X1 [Brienomyrus brachyistius]XP_048870892.1 ras-associating and dilute domain-containing protein isoform X2 [Brienomyrus brachyistius]